MPTYQKGGPSKQPILRSGADNHIVHLSCLRRMGDGTEAASGVFVNGNILFIHAHARKLGAESYFSLQPRFAPKCSFSPAIETKRPRNPQVRFKQRAQRTPWRLPSSPVSRKRETFRPFLNFHAKLLPLLYGLRESDIRFVPCMETDLLHAVPGYIDTYIPRVLDLPGSRHICPSAYLRARLPHLG